jgi:CHC2 zinc finger
LKTRTGVYRISPARHLLPQDDASRAGRARAPDSAAHHVARRDRGHGGRPCCRATTTRPSASAGAGHRPRADPLRELEPAVYVTALTGQAVGRSGKVSCPFHEDRTPSFHVYERADQGWYCFGCRRHGQTVYDLASEIWQLQTRGDEFLELRARLYALLLPGIAPPPGRR